MFVTPHADVDVEIEEKPKSRGAAAMMSEVGPNLDRLWAYGCALTRGRNVSCIAWNKSNPVSQSVSPPSSVAIERLLC